MSKVKVLTIQFDVTGFSEDAIDTLKANLYIQGKFENHIEPMVNHRNCEADVFNVSIREVKMEDS